MVRISVKPLKGYSFVSLARQALNGHKGWPAAWRSPATRKGYDVIIIGAGGHGLATAYYLARNHGVTDVAVIEKRWLGSGNSGRNTQVTRSNYFWPQSAAFYDHSLKLFENLGRKINFNVMLSQRGVLNLAHSVHELESLRRWANAIRVNGIDFRPAQFPVGACCRTRLAQVAAIVVATGVNDLDIYVDRSYESYLGSWLEDSKSMPDLQRARAEK